MKENKDIDQLLLNSLVDHKPIPPEEGKQRFLDAASQFMPGKGNLISDWKSIGIALILVLSVGSIFFYFMSIRPDKTQTDKPSYIIDQNSISSNESSQIEINNSISTPSFSIKTQADKDPSIEKQDIDGRQENKVVSSIVNTMQNEPIDNSGTIKSDNVIPQHQAHSFNRITVIPSLYVYEVYSFRDYINANASIINAPILTLASNAASFSDYLDKDMPSQSISHKINIAYSLVYQPELIFNIIENNKLVHNVGANIHFRIFDGKYQIRTGIGASISKGYYEYAVNYNEYMGSYLGLDSITFAWSDNNYYLLPTYYQSKREVFDTAAQFDVSKVYKRFIYLQVPITFGYDFIEKEKYSLGLRFGPVLSVLSSTRTISSSYDPGNNKIIQINQITPDRLQTNWSLMAGFNMGIFSKKNFFYEIEPQFSYYFNSVFQKNNATNSPYSIGIRFAIGIK